MRDDRLDNFKGLLIALVIVGHVIEPLRGRFGWVDGLYAYIYLFHMPMFAYVSGILSSRSADKEQLTKILTHLILPYLFLEVLYSLFDHLAFSRDTFELSFLTPYWILWYLVSLAAWRILLPIFSRFRFPILASLITGLACGMGTLGLELSFSRTFVFFPFFIAGHYWHAPITRKLDAFHHSKRLASFVALSYLLILLIMPNTFGFSTRWLHGSLTYSELGVAWSEGMLIRLYLYGLATLLGLSFLSLIPKARTFATRYGQQSLSIYILHGFIVKTILALGLYLQITNGWQAALLTLSSLLLLPLLSSPLASRLVRFITNPFGINDLLTAKPSTGK